MCRFGPDSGLRLTMISNKDEQNGALAETYGVRVSIHAPGVDGHPDADGYSVNVGDSTQIGVRFASFQSMKIYCHVQFLI